jgi:hypothetical protein
MFHNEYKIFIENEEVLKSMTILDEKYAEGVEEGIAIGEAKAQAAYNTRLENILVAGIKNKEAHPFLKTLAADMGISDARLNELLAKNGIAEKPFAIV